MSNVRKNERKEHSLVLLDKALDLYDRMTMAIANEKTFDRAYANLINRIDQEATTIYHYLRSANEDYDSRIKEDAEMRIALEEKAIKQCMWLKTDIRLAKKKFHLRKGKLTIYDVDRHFKAYKASVRYGCSRNLLCRLNRWYAALREGYANGIDHYEI